MIKLGFWVFKLHVWIIGFLEIELGLNFGFYCDNQAEVLHIHMISTKIL